MVARETGIMACLTLCDSLIKVVLHTLALVCDVAELPEGNSAIAGSTGSGYSTCFTTVVTSGACCVLTIVIIAAQAGTVRDGVSMVGGGTGSASESTCRASLTAIAAS